MAGPLLAAENKVDSRTLELTAKKRSLIPSGLQSPDIFVARAHGARMTDVGGREYLDFAGGVGCLNLGHTLTEIVAAIHEQADRYLHVGFSAAGYEPYLDVCERLVACHPGSGAVKALLVSTGAEAVENAVKVARAATGRPAVLCFDNAFHGRTLLGATLSHKAMPYKKSFGPLAPEIYRAVAPYPYRGVTAADSLASVRSVLRGQVDPAEVAAIIYEPVQGEGGFLPAPPEFLPALQELCREHGILLICDEIQSGMCRTGPPAATMHYAGVEPDLIAWGKSLGGGLPLSAVTGRAELMDAVHPGGLASGTFGGNPLACAAATVVLDRVLDPAFQAAARDFGDRLRARADALAARCPAVGDVRGLGAMVAVELVEDPAGRAPATKLTSDTIARAKRDGLLIKSCGTYGNVLRFLVPLTATDAELDEGFAVLERALTAA